MMMYGSEQGGNSGSTDVVCDLYSRSVASPIQSRT